MVRDPMGRLVFAASIFVAFAARAEIKERIAAVVNGQPITLSEVDERVAAEMGRTMQKAPSAARDEERKDLLHRGLQQLIDEKLVETEAGSLGLEVTEDELSKQLEALARQNGLDIPGFREALQQQGIEYDTVRESLRRQSLMVRLLQFKVKPRTVTDAEVQSAYAAQNADADFEVKARHIFIATPAGAAPAQLKLAQTKADGALRRIRGGDSFALVARDVSEGPSAKEGGDLGYVHRGVMDPALDKAVFSTQVGQVSPLIKTDKGYHLVLVEEHRKLAAKPLTEVQEELRQKLANDSIMKEREHYLATLRKGAQIDERL